MDHAGPMNGQTYLFAVDSYSKWLEVIRVSSTITESTCSVLRRSFAMQRIPRTVVSDKGRWFVSAKMQQLSTTNGTRHICSAAYPASNGQAERYVRIFKEMLRMLKEGDIETKLCRL